MKKYGISTVFGHFFAAFPIEFASFYGKKDEVPAKK